MRSVKAFLVRNRGFITFMVCMLLFRSAVADWNVVPTGSMQPTIRIGDRIVVDKAAYDIRLPFTHVALLHRGDPARGDIVVLESALAGERLVKRVVGVPGDVVALRANRLYVNGRAADYRAIRVHGIADDSWDPATYATENVEGRSHAVRWSNYRPSPDRDFGPVAVPAGRYLLMGDNRDNSRDSRYYGFFPREEITGRATRVAVSLDPEHHYLPRPGRYWTMLK
jgi:signal peptidase I